MCGIVGFINCGSEAALKAANQRLQHRGPDGHGTRWFAEKNSGLGHTRLSIIDLSDRAAQPMYHGASQHWITFNGEVYNFLEIRKKLEEKGHQFLTDSDTEVVLHAYIEWKEGCLSLFNGMFAFCIYHEASGEVFIARDHQGIKPLYYWHKHGKLAFASEVKAILELEEYERRPDMEALHTPVHYQIAPKTGFRDILKLPAGHFLRFSPEQGLKVHRYWNLSVTENTMTEGAAIEALESLLQDAIKLNLVSDIPVGVMLSGGLDSSLVAALMQQRKKEALNSFTIKFDSKDLKKQGNVDDSYYARQMAQQFGFKHHEIQIKPDITDLLPKMVYHLDEPIADPAAINTYLISQAAREQGIYVLLTGIGADEFFAGYRAHLACLKAEPYQKAVPGFMQKLIARGVAKLPESSSKRNFKYIRWVKRFIEVGSLPPFERHMALKNSALTPENFNEYFQNAPAFEESLYVKRQQALFDETSHASYLSQMCFSDTLTYMTDHNLNYCDKATMAAGVEGRPTLIDKRIIELMFSLSPELKIKGNVQKYLLKKVAEKHVPNEIIYRPKAPFSAPMRGWLKDELKPMVNDILSYDSLKKGGIYQPDYVEKLIRDNDKGIADNSQLIWRLMINQIWLKTFFDN